MCTLCALIFVLNSRGPQPAAAEGAEEPSVTPPPNAAAVSAAYRRMSQSKPDLEVGVWPLQLYGSGRPVTEEPEETVRVGGVPVDARIADALRAAGCDLAETENALKQNGFTILSHVSEEEWHCFVCQLVKKVPSELF